MRVSSSINSFMSIVLSVSSACRCRTICSAKSSSIGLSESEKDD